MALCLTHSAQLRPVISPRPSGTPVGPESGADQSQRAYTNTDPADGPLGLGIGGGGPEGLAVTQTLISARFGG